MLCCGFTAITGQCNLKTVQCRVKKRILSWCPVKVFHMQVTLDSLGLLPGHVLLVFSSSTLVVLNQVPMHNRIGMQLKNVIVSKRRTYRQTLEM